MVYHSVTIDMDSLTSSCVLDIMQGDANTHQLLIKLICCDNHYFNITGYIPQLEFYDQSNKTTVLTTAVDVINSYKGYVSYVLGERIVTDPARYTVTLKLIQDGSTSTCSQMSGQFILNIVKDGSSTDCPSAPSTEVTISEEFYCALKEHLCNTKIHLSDSDRAILDFLSENLDSFVTHTEFDPVKQNVENLNDITSNLTTNLETLSTNVTNVISTVEALAKAIENYNDQFQEMDSRLGTAETNIYILSTQVKELMDTQQNLEWVELV